MTDKECEIETSKAIMEMRNLIAELEKENAELKEQIGKMQNIGQQFEEEKCLFGDGTEPKPVSWICKLTLGYTGKYMLAVITKIELVNGKDTDLAIDTPVYAIHLSDVREIEHEESV